jgi:hypothetical protein
MTAPCRTTRAAGLADRADNPGSGAAIDFALKALVENRSAHAVRRDAGSDGFPDRQEAARASHPAGGGKSGAVSGDLVDLTSR